MGFNPVSDRIATIRLQCKPVNMTVLQVYAPTSTAEEEEMERVLREGTACSGRDTERRCAVCDRRLECQSGTGRDKRHNRKIRNGGTE